MACESTQMLIAGRSSEYSLALTQLAHVQRRNIVRQAAATSGRQRCLHFDVQQPAMFISRQNVQNRQLVIVEFLAQKWIQDLHLSDPWLTDQDRVQKVDRDPGMLDFPASA